MSKEPLGPTWEMHTEEGKALERECQDSWNRFCFSHFAWSCSLVYHMKFCCVDLGFYLWSISNLILRETLFGNESTILYLEIVTESKWFLPLHSAIVSWLLRIFLINCVLSCSSCVRLCTPMDCSPPGFSVHGILQAGILRWVAMSRKITFPLFHKNFLSVCNVKITVPEVGDAKKKKKVVFILWRHTCHDIDKQTQNRMC